MAKAMLSMSVIMPAYNAEKLLPASLGALCESSLEPLEIFVVNDGSTDDTAQLAEAYGARVLNTLHSRSGPGAARNVAAQVAAGDLLMFVDADVVVQEDTLALIRGHFSQNSGVGAVFGSYDAEPAAEDFLSQYKNLQHHYVHQISSRDATTFWAGCGAVRREVFLELGGFDVTKYVRPSIEDIELGYRLRESGWKIRLDARIQVKHLKRWQLGNWLYTEIVCRAIPWSKLIISRAEIPSDLNVGFRDRLSAVLAWLAVGFLVLSLFQPNLIVVSIVALAMIVYLNRGFYGFLVRHRGLWFGIRALPTHGLYYLYSSLCFAGCWLSHLLTSRSDR